jgi:hypothetical protein
MTSKAALKDKLLNIIFVLLLMAGLLLFYSSRAIEKTYACDGIAQGCNPPVSCSFQGACNPIDARCMQGCDSINCSHCKCIMETGTCTNDPARYCNCQTCTNFAGCSQ